MGGDICALSGHTLDPDPTEAMDRKYQEVADRLRVIGDQLDRELASRLLSDRTEGNHRPNPNRPRRRDQYHSDLSQDRDSAIGRMQGGRQTLGIPTPIGDLVLQSIEVDAHKSGSHVTCRGRIPECRCGAPEQPGDVVRSTTGYNSRTKARYTWLASRLNCTRDIDMNHNYSRHNVVVGGIWASMMRPEAITSLLGALVTRCWRAARYGFHLSAGIIAAFARGAKTIATTGLFFYLELDMNPIISVRNRPEVTVFGTIAQRLLIASAIHDAPDNSGLRRDARPFHVMECLDCDHNTQDPPTTALR